MTNSRFWFDTRRGWKLVEGKGGTNGVYKWCRVNVDDWWLRGKRVFIRIRESRIDDVNRHFDGLGCSVLIRKSYYAKSWVYTEHVSARHQMEKQTMTLARNLIFVFIFCEECTGEPSTYISVPEFMQAFAPPKSTLHLALLYPGGNRICVASPPIFTFNFGSFHKFVRQLPRAVWI